MPISLPSNALAALIIIVFTMVITVRMRKLTMGASIAGGIVGSLLFLGTGLTGIAMMAGFFVFGTAATSWKGASKTAAGIAEENAGRRTAMQVLANAGLAGGIGGYVFISGNNATYLTLGIASAFAAAAGDTLSSELGNVYGKRYFNILSFKKDQRGLNGVVSLEGFLAGISGSAMIALIYCIGYGWGTHFAWIVIAGLAGNLTDSVLGATVERQHLLNNDAVNFLNTCVAAFCGMVLF